MRTLFHYPALLLTTLSVFQSCAACNIPVFRYALEHWQPDSLELLLFRDAPLSQAERALVRELSAASSKGDGLANINLVDVKIPEKDGKIDGEFASLLEVVRENNSTISLPLVVAISRHNRGLIPHWIGPLSKLRKTTVLNSPVRRKIVERLTAGDSIVWLVQKGNSPTKNQMFLSRLRQTLDELSKKLKLPDGIGLPGSELHSEIPLLMQFHVIDFDPSDPQERVLSTLCESLQPAAVKDGLPIAIPIFGRGRALEVIPSDDLSDSLIEDLTVFLCGACSCQVKERNPGFDLLISTDWETQLFGEGGTTPAESLRTNPSQRDKPALMKIPPGRKR